MNTLLSGYEQWKPNRFKYKNRNISRTLMIQNGSSREPISYLLLPINHCTTVSSRCAAEQTARPRKPLGRSLSDLTSELMEGAVRPGFPVIGQRDERICPPILRGSAQQRPGNPYDILPYTTECRRLSTPRVRLQQFPWQ